MKVSILYSEQRRLKKKLNMCYNYRRVKIWVEKSLEGNHQNITNGASLVAQWLRICLPMQGTRVRALVWEDPTCHGATKPVSHNY